MVIGASALLTYLLPYHELTSEISARTAPTLLDLYVAAFCALAAAYTTARQSSDTVAAAAGTAISIALVPPLCVVGWGIGARSSSVSRGASLLFTANLCAILLFTAAVFLLFRFDAVPTEDLGGDGSPTDRIAKSFHRFLGAKYGPAVRLLMPVVLVGAVFVPLRRALNEVAWKTHARTEVEKVLSDLPPARQAVQSTVVVANGAVSLRLLVVGAPSEAKVLETTLKQRIERATGIVPTVDVIAVPDEASVRTIAEGAVAPVPTKPVLDTAQLRDIVDSALRAAWPSTAGALRAWQLVVEADGSQSIVVVHFGEPLGTAGVQLLERAVHDQVSGAFTVRDVAISTSPSTADPPSGGDWLPSLTRAVDTVVDAKIGTLCVTLPNAEAGSPARQDARVRTVMADTAREVRAELARVPVGRAIVTSGDRWHVRVAADGCPADTGEDGGAPRDANAAEDGNDAR